MKHTNTHDVLHNVASCHDATQDHYVKHDVIHKIESA